MPAATPRRPRFLDTVPDERTVEPAAFSRPGEPRRSDPVPLRRVQPAPAPEPVAAPAAPSAPPTLPPEAIERLASAIDVLRLQAERLAERARSDALEIGFQVARRVLETELRSSPEALFALVRSAIRKAGESRKVQVRIRPDDLAKMASPAGQETLAEFSAAEIELKADSSLGPGDVVVETDFGRVDGRIESRLDELRRAVDGASLGEVA